MSSSCVRRGTFAPLLPLVLRVLTCLMVYTALKGLLLRVHVLLAITVNLQTLQSSVISLTSVQSLPRRCHCVPLDHIARTRPFNFPALMGLSVTRARSQTFLVLKGGTVPLRQSRMSVAQGHTARKGPPPKRSVLLDGSVMTRHPKRYAKKGTCVLEVHSLTLPVRVEVTVQVVLILRMIVTLGMCVQPLRNE